MNDTDIGSRLPIEEARAQALARIKHYREILKEANVKDPIASWLLADAAKDVHNATTAAEIVKIGNVMLSGILDLKGDESAPKAASKALHAHYNAWYRLAELHTARDQDPRIWMRQDGHPSLANILDRIKHELAVRDSLKTLVPSGPSNLGKRGQATHRENNLAKSNRRELVKLGFPGSSRFAHDQGPHTAFVTDRQAARYNIRR